ncbi:MAG: CocE/NonD family hydrolase, partial [Alphaproteobacteria bacterium]|nr:CocE/NonD family hydrolase [Alphaproteobacteria bacterium]
DVRGTGDSEGIYGAQFAAQYAEDAVDAIAWIASQPWCTGAVAMFGLSWGAGIALATAALQPPALKAIVCASGIDSRFATRFINGAMLTGNPAGIPAWMLYATRPPDPAIVGDRWRAIWLERLERCAITGEEWLSHQSHDDYWKDTGVAGRVESIQCPIMAVSGWADPGFAAAMLRVLAQARVPRRGLIGPWSHRYAHVGLPGPAIGYLQETLRWLDHWLKSKDTGVMGDPALRVWVPDAEPPNERPTEQAGRWVGLAAWPAPETGERNWALNPGRLDDTAGSESPMAVHWRGEVGEAAGEWMPIFTTGANPEMAGDQRDDDARSLCFDSAPLGARFEFVGAPMLELDVSANQPIATLVARLCDVAPDGTSRRVSFGALNLVHRDGTDRPALIEPGRRYRVRLALYDVAYAFPSGHRIRLALSASSWPMIWPSPAPATVTVIAGASRLALPVLAGAAAAQVVATPETAPPVPMTMRRPMSYERRRSVDGDGRHILEIREDFGASHYGDIDIEADEIATRRTSMHPDDPATATVEVEARWQLARGDWRVGGLARTRVTGDGGAFTVDTRLEAREGDTTIFTRDWHFRVPRRFA